ncbi:MAG TPA: DUF4830 domain-containing protein [Ruminococcus sp.]|nr:DUF4830 domain-containing protein [Ruminococcus sp.]
MKKRTFAILAAAFISGSVLFLQHGRKTADPIERAVIPASTVGERMDYFASHGWEVEEIAGKDITIPEVFSSAYEEYVSLQDKQGLPLRENAGRNAKLYVYEVKNYSPENRKMLAELLVCDDKAVASMVYSDDGGSIRMAVS